MSPLPRERGSSALLRFCPAAPVLLVVVIGVLLNATLFLLIGVGRRGYLHDYRAAGSPDADHYILLGENAWLRGAFSREARPPYTPDVVRTPVYPLISGGLQALFGTIWPLYVLQALLSVGTSVLVWRIASDLLGAREGLVAGALYASNLAMAALNFEALSEPLFVLLSTLGVAIWVRCLVPSEATHYRRHALVGVVLAVAILTRPAGLYLPIALAGAEVLLLRRPPLPRRLGGPLILVLSAYLLVCPWIVRNYVLYGLPRLTTADTINLLYFGAAGAYQAEFGIDREAAQDRIASDYGVQPLVRTNNFWLADEDVATIDATQRAAARDIIARYPGAFCRSSVTGVGKSLVGHNTSLLANATGRRWHAPGLGNLVRGEIARFWGLLRTNDTGLVIAFLWQLAFVLAATALGPIGCWRAWRTPHLQAVSCALLMVATYHVLTIAIVGMDAYVRHRAAVEPIVCVFIAAGASRLLSRTPVASATSPG